MHDVLKKLFDKVMFYEADCIKVGRKLDEEVNTIIEPLRESMSEKELETIRYMIFQHHIPQKRMDFIWESAQLLLCLWKQCSYQMTLTSHKIVKY